MWKPPLFMNYKRLMRMTIHVYQFLALQTTQSFKKQPNLVSSQVTCLACLFTLKDEPVLQACCHAKLFQVAHVPSCHFLFIVIRGLADSESVCVFFFFLFVFAVSR